MGKILDMAVALEEHCSKTTNCMNCELYSENGKYCMVEGLMPWEWELKNLQNENSAQAEKKEKK